MKVRPKCSALVSVLKCACGHHFAMKQKAFMKTKKVAMKCLRALESDNDKLVKDRELARAQCVKPADDSEDQDKTYKAKQRSLESQHKTRTLQTAMGYE